MVIISIPSLIDPSLAPAGHHTIHAYYAANEPYESWAGLDRRSEEYRRLKEERARPLWRALEKIIPDVRAMHRTGHALHHAHTVLLAGTSTPYMATAPTPTPQYGRCASE